MRTAADVDDVTALDFEALAAAVARGSLALAVDAGDLAAVRDGLLAAGRRRHAPRSAVTGDGTGETQYTTTSTVDSFVAAALGFTGRVVLTARRRRRAPRQAELVGEPAAVRLEGARARAPRSRPAR